MTAPLAIVQARMGSSRLPGKVLLPLAGKPTLLHIVERLRAAPGIGNVVVATSDLPQDAPIREMCGREGIPCFAGSETDVLDRFYRAAREFGGDPVVRVTGDCPLVDPAVVGRLLALYARGGRDHVAVATGAGAAFLGGGRYPDGLDAECFSFASLERAWREASEQSDREHVTPYIWRNKARFATELMTSPRDFSAQRWTVDTESDYRFVSRVYEALWRPHRHFTMEDVCDLLAREPDLLAVNRDLVGREGYLAVWNPEGGTVTSNTKIAKGPALYARAKKLIPGGTQLLSKRPEMFLPGEWPSYYRRAKGVEVTDLDGNVFVDMGLMGIGACILGYADPDVDAAVKAAIDDGVVSSLNAPEEVDLAEALVQLHPWADMVRYARGGGEAMAMAVRIARARTGRDVVAFSGYHGWNDWYLAANLGDDKALDGHLMPGLSPAGVPRGLKGTALPFHYNRIEEFREIVARTRGELAAIVMEPRRGPPPQPGFLEEIRRTASEIGAVLIFDEVTTGFRMTAGGIHRLLGVDPDIAVFAKAMANGYPMAAVLGRADVMEAAQSTFISSTNWTDRIGPVAALATIRKFQTHNVAAHVQRIGSAVQAGWMDAGQAAGLPVEADGLPSLAHFAIRHPEEHALSTLFTQTMLERGYLAYSQFKPSLAHTDAHVERYLGVVRDVFRELADAASRGQVSSRLRGPLQRRGFYRLTS